MKIQVTAVIERGMRLDRKKPERTVTDTIFVTAVGHEMFLALDTEGKEHSFYAALADGYAMNGWADWATRSKS